MNKISTFLSTLFAFFGLIAGANAQCAAGEVAVTAEVSTDTWGYELYWEVTPDGDACGTNTISAFGNPLVGCDGGGLSVADNGDAGAYPNNEVITEDLGCLSTATCVTIHMVDDYGDGGSALQFYSDGIAADAFVMTFNDANSTFTFCPQAPASYDASVSAAAEYTIVPITQVSTIGTSATIINSGGLTITNAVVTSTVYDGVGNIVHTETSAPVATIAVAASESVALTGYTPTAVDAYVVEYTVAIDESDAEAGNDFASILIEIDEVTYARDDSQVSALLGNPGGCFGGNIYDLVNPGAIESVSVFHANQNVGDTMELIVHAVDVASGLPGALLGTSGLYTLTAEDSAAVEAAGVVPLTLPVLNNDGGLLSLAPGAYFVGFVQVSFNNASICLSDNIYTPGKTLFSFDGVSFIDMGDTPFPGAWLVRPNMSTCEVLESTDTQVSCGSFEWIDGNIYTENNNTATFVITTSEGCDSTVTLDLTVNNIDVATDVQTSCESIVWIDGETYAENNNTATFVLQNANGCDSTVTLDLTIYGSTETVDVQGSCEPYTWIDGVEYTESNDTASFLLTSVNGCDSLVTLDLTIYSADASTDVQTSCEPIVWIDGETYAESNNTATFVLSNANGCDSTVTLDLTIYGSTETVDIQASCVPYTWIDGVEYTESNNAASFLLQTANGCDSLVTLDLTIADFIETTDVQTSCGDFTWTDGITYTESNNTATQELQSVSGCDSTVTLNLTVNALPDVQVDNTDGVLTVASGEGLVYDWVDCGTGSALGQVDNVFTPTAEGSYQVYVADIESGCADTSECETIEFVALDEFNSFGLNIFPNPSNGLFSIELNSLSVNKVEITVLDVSGKVISNDSFETTSSKLNIPMNISNVEEGVYFVRINAGRIITNRVVVSHK